MKLLKNKYGLTLDDVSLMFETDDLNILKVRSWVPRWVLRRQFERFMLEFSEMFNPAEVSEMVDREVMRARMINRVNNLLHPLYMGLLLSDREDFKEVFKEMFGREYKSREDLKSILSEMDRLKGKLKEQTHSSPAPAGKISFEEVITYVEAILERSLDRNMKLYQFKHQYDLAVKRAKELEKLNRNG